MGCRVARPLLAVLGLLVGCGSPPLPAPPPAVPIPTADADVLRFVAIGDVGNGSASMRLVADAVARTCAERGCDLVAILGDNLYPAGMESDDDPRFEAWVVAPYERSGAPLVILLGNHDYADGRQAAVAQRQVDWVARTGRGVLPAPYYEVAAGPADLVVADTSRVFWGDPAQIAWAADALARAQRRWRVVLGHHTWRSEGPHGNAGAYEGIPGIPWSSGAAVSRLLDGVVCGNADLYVGGHDHSLQLLDAPCGGHIVVSGAAARGTSLPGHGNTAPFATVAPGFAWIELGDRGRVVFLDQHGAVLHDADIGPPLPRPGL